MTDEPSEAYEYLCECNDHACHETMAISEDAYRRLSAVGSVLHVSHVARDCPDILASHGDEAIVVRSNLKTGWMNKTRERGPAPVRRRVGVRAW